MPGMRELGMLGVSEGLDDTFADVGELAKSCRFTDCGHSAEPGCAVRAAIERHDLSEQRLRGYLKLKKESAFHDLSYVERREEGSRLWPHGSFDAEAQGQARSTLARRTANDGIIAPR